MIGYVTLMCDKRAVILDKHKMIALWPQHECVMSHVSVNKHVCLITSLVVVVAAMIDRDVEEVCYK